MQALYAEYHYAECRSAECQFYWVLSWLIVTCTPFMLSVSYTGCYLGSLSHASPLCWVSLWWMFLSWVSVILGIIYADCHMQALYAMSLCWVSIILGVIYADCHMQELYEECHYAECQLYWVLSILSVCYTGYNLCWLSHARTLCRMSVILGVIYAECQLYWV